MSVAGIVAAATWVFAEAGAGATTGARRRAVDRKVASNRRILGMGQLRMA
ncbi:hypothetical protein [Nonomuraea recticatena]|uniref:Uncharacterized protein n=1 Tax=Nonomuraea recticatena TaxID=46178 RepID=A0ABP6FUM6_9ACTN